MQPNILKPLKPIQKPETKGALEPLSTLIPEMENKEIIQDFVEVSKTKNQINAINRQKTEMTNIFNNMSDDFDDILVHIRAAGVTLEQIAEMNDEDIQKIFSDAEGNQYSVNAKFETLKEESAFKRDFLVMILENSHRFQDIDDKLAELDEEMKAFDQEMVRLQAETNGDVISLVRADLIKSLELNPDSEHAVGTQELVDSIDDAVTLNRLLEYYKTQNIHTALSDFRHRREEVYKKFVKNCKNTQIITNFRGYDNIEVKFLPEKYHHLGGLFAFLVVKQFSYKKAFTRNECVWLLQLNANLNLLLIESERGFKLNETQAANKAALIEAIAKVLDLLFVSDEQ